MKLTTISSPAAMPMIAWRWRGEARNAPASRRFWISAASNSSDEEKAQAKDSRASSMLVSSDAYGLIGTDSCHERRLAPQGKQMVSGNSLGQLILRRPRRGALRFAVDRCATKRRRGFGGRFGVGLPSRPPRDCGRSISRDRARHPPARSAPRDALPLPAQTRRRRSRLRVRAYWRSLLRRYRTLRVHARRRRTRHRDRQAGSQKTLHRRTGRQYRTSACCDSRFSQRRAAPRPPPGG